MAGTEQAVKDALRAHQGGLGPSLNEDDKAQIINGFPNQAENTAPVIGKDFFEGVVEALDNHPVTWILK